MKKRVVFLKRTTIVLYMINSLGFDKKPEDTRVIVAMSGGVDSSVVAALLHEQGYNVVGVTLLLYNPEKSESDGCESSCGTNSAIEDAKKIANRLDIEHHVLKNQTRFSDSVIDNFVDSYLKGETPNPCVRCNQEIKFKDMLNFAKELGGDCMATGHYIQREVNNEGVAELHKAVDDTKDQSYFLFAIQQDQLDFARFPLGGWKKEKTRKLAEKYGLFVADKPDSQDICFAPNGTYPEVVKKYRPNAVKPGEIVHLDGRVLGNHNGIINYTIGQRRGLGIGGGHTYSNSPLFVVEMRPDKNQVVVGPYEALAKDTVYIDDTNWFIDISEEGLKVEVKLRSTQRPQPATLYPNHVLLDEPAFGIAAGQACVCYINDRVIGGGWITSSNKK